MNEQSYTDATIQLPEQASTLAPMVDSLYYDIFWISVVFFVGIVACMVWFGWRFRRRPGVTSKPPGHHNALELFWTFSPLILLAYMFHDGFTGYMFMSVPPENSINVRVRGYKWRWEFEQPNGMVEGELNVPVNRPVRLVMSSAPNGPEPQDWAVLHSFFIPSFRVKRDVVPGMYTSLWFEATREGDFQIYCTEYCGTGHSRMLSTVHVLSECEYQAYLERGPSRPAELENDAQWGERLFSSNGCPACHGVQAAQGTVVGPNLANVAGYPQPLQEGGEQLADADYLRESIQQPQAHIVRGFGNVAAMPAFDRLPQSQINALIAYIASLSDRGNTVELAAEGEGGGDAAPPCP